MKEFKPKLDHIDHNKIVSFKTMGKKQKEYFQELKYTTLLVESLIFV